MKKTKRFLTTLAALMLAVGGWAADRVVVAAIQNGTVTASSVAADGEQTVTLTVTPAADYFITAADITVTKTAPVAQARRRTPGYADGISVSAANVDATGKGTYTFTLPEGYGAYVEASFTERYSLTAVTLSKTHFIYDTTEKTVNVVSVKASTMDVPADSYEVSGNKATNVGTYTVTVTGLGHFKGTATAQFTISKAGLNVEAEDTETGKEVDDVTVLGTVSDDGQSIVIDELVVPAAATNEPLTVYIPEQIGGYAVSGISAEAFEGKNITDVYLPDTEQPLTIEEDALPGTANIHTTLALLDDYALMASLKANYEAVKISATVTPANKYWSFSSGVDCVLHETLNAFIVYMDNGTPRIVKIEESKLVLVDGRRGIKANNGVLLACKNGKGGDEYEILASPGNQQSGVKPSTTDAKSYGNQNQLEPVIESKNYKAGEYLVLKNNAFHSIKSNASKMKACKAVLRINK